jgi:coniferyl-aldehyde dehydrogenase
MVQTVSVGHHDRTRMHDYTADEIAEALRIQRGAFLRDGPPTAAVRQNRIDRLAALTFENADALGDAMRQDFGNRPIPTTIFPTYVVR